MSKYSEVEDDQCNALSKKESALAGQMVDGCRMYGLSSTSCRNQKSEEFEIPLLSMLAGAASTDGYEGVWGKAVQPNH